MSEQVRTRPTSSARIMRSPLFRRGLDEVRAGQLPRFDDYATACLWAYERGRLFGCIAPMTMPLFFDGELNRKAVTLLDAAFDRGLIL